MTTGVAVPPVILRFCDNRGNPLVGGQLLTQVGGINTPVYQDSGLTTPLPNPIILNSRGEVATAAGASSQMFLTPNYVYTFTLSDASGNQIWSATYVDGVQLTQSSVGQLLWPQTAAELAAGVTPTNYYYPPYTLLRYGADPTGATDATGALQNAINCAQQADYAMVTVGIPGALLKIGSSWTIDTNKTGIDFQGAYINAAAFTTGNWCSPVQSNSNVNLRPLLNSAHPVKNATIQGPGTANATAVLLNIADTNPVSGTYNISCLSFQNLTSFDWGQDVIFGNGAFCINFSQCQFGSDSGTATTYSIVQQNATNAGERNTFSQCMWFNKALIANNASGAADLYFSQCSFDGMTRALTAGAGGTITCVGCHIESGTDSDYWIYATGTNSRILLRSCEVILDAAKSAFAVGYSDASCTWGGIYIDGLSFSAASGYSALLVAGTGNAQVRDVVGLGTAAGQPSIYANAMNMTADPIFASGALTADGWTASGSTPPTVEGTKPYSGSFDVKFTNTGGTSTLTSRTFPCQPGQVASVDVFACIPTFNAGVSFSGVIKYVRADGTALTSVIGGTTGAGFAFMNPTGAVANYTEYSSNESGGLGRAPPGTSGVVLVFSLSGGGGGTAFLGQVKLTVG